MLTALLCCAVNIVFAQMSLQGKVVDEDEKPIAGASVWIEYTTIGTSTNQKGEFSLEKIPDGSNLLRVSALDYTGGRKQIDSSVGNVVIKMKHSPLKLNEVVVTGTGTLNKLKNSPVAIDVISQKELQNTSIPTFENAMIALNPSLSFTPNAMGSYMQLNGLSNRYILVLVDGKKLGGDVGGNVDLNRIDMGNIKRIEILKGAASSLYGSDAIAGVINIITNRPKDLLNFSTETRLSEYGQFNQNINLYLNAGGFSSATSFQRNQADGWQLNKKELLNGEEVDTDKQAMLRFYSDIFSQRFGYTPTKELSLYVEGSAFDKKFKRPVSAYGFDMKYVDYSFGAGAKYLLKNNGVISLDWNTDRFEYSKVYLKETTDKNGTVFIPGQEEFVRRQKYHNINLKSSFYAGKYNKVTVGTEYKMDNLYAPSDSIGGSKDVYTLAFYAQDEINLFGKLSIVPGIRYIYNETFKNRVTPKISAMYSLDYFNFRASYAAGFKTPELKQLFMKTEVTSRGNTTLSIGNKDLKPESSNYYSLNTEYVRDFLTISLTGYINNLRNMINTYEVELTPEEIAEGYNKKSSYHNIGKSRIQGIDLAFNSYLGANFTLGGGYSYVNAKDLDTGKRLQRISRHTGNVNLNWFKDWGILKSNFNINGRLQSRRYYDDGDDARAYQLWNIATRHTFKSINGLVFEPGFGIENIFDFVDDKPFNRNYATLSPGRTYYASLKIKFSK
ncbi:outer membrane receptor for ferrienterochelin and colicins [Dysgonomonas macrotermitis]|uniref:Outer membrane receptor for ferrienterochelin and colicins n=2 Tax=Dysgonomonas macrotermitis TaxID=1346286 RepID=A0A1M4YGK8_9BACT|nr:outer membrane receptor for ferrienterochelin and colicins [Dysgonomonas macrotermitis]